jgi:4-amino-4-deoxy-L-arabinose transferase-like glycosyltransferase
VRGFAGGALTHGDARVPTPPGPEPVEGRELLALLALTLAALGLRAWQLGAASLGQYDEGVYAMSAWTLWDRDMGVTLWPGQNRFSPPVYFGLVSLAYRLSGGPSDAAAIWVNVILGALTVPAVWWVTRRWFGAVAAVVAATLLAFSEFHVIMSRSGLTDVTFTLVFLLAVAALIAALERGGIGRAVVAGLMTGLAWNTKYHGWFVLVIGAGAAVGCWWFGGERARLREWIRTLAISAGVAALLYLPWMLHVRREPGSLGGWTSYFRSMLSLRWPRRFMAHVVQQGYLEGVFTRLSLLVAVVLAVLLLRRALDGARARLALGGVAAVAATLGGMAATAVLAVAAVPSLLARRREITPWVVLTWLALWVVAAPLYRPYFRLLLPMLLVAAVLAGVSVARLLRSAPESAGSPGWRDPALAAVMAGLVLLASRWRDDDSHPWRAYDPGRESAARISALIGPATPVAVVGEPSVAFYLRRKGHPVFGDITSPAMLDTLSAPHFVVAGVYARRTRALREALASREGLRYLARFPVEPTEIRLLDDLSTDAARAYRAAPDSTFDLQLYSLGAAERLP